MGVDRKSSAELERRIETLERTLALLAQDLAHEAGAQEDGWGVGDPEGGPDVPPYAPGGDSFPWTLLSFGYVISGTDVLIYRGRFVWHKPAGPTTWTSVCDTAKAYKTLDCSATATHTVYAIFDPAGDSGAGELTVSLSAGGADKITVALYEFVTADGAVTLTRIYHMCDIDAIPLLAP